MLTKLIDHLPAWLHPRFPLVAKETRYLWAVDFRILQFGDFLSLLIRGSRFIPFMIVVAFLVADIQLLGFLLFPFVIIISTSIILIGELLFWRVMISIPSQASDFIAGERERGTWETLLSTPIPRHQIILSKFSAAFWNNAHALWPLVIGRYVMMVLWLVEGLSLGSLQQTTRPQDVGLLFIIGVLFCLTPLIEIGSNAGVGLMASLLSTNRLQIHLGIWFYWLIFRVGAAFAMVGSFSLEGQAANQQLGMVLFPHWTLFAIWLNTAHEQFIGLLVVGGGLYIGLPIVLCIMSLALTIRFVQYQNT